MIWRFLILFLTISLFFFSSFAQRVEKISVRADRYYYRITLTFNGKPWFKFFKDPKRDILTLKTENTYRFDKTYYSVRIVGERNLITIFVKNPKLDTSKARVIRRYHSLVVLIPIKNLKRVKYVVVIDPGHGGKDSGAHYYGVKEKDINLSVAKKLYYYLQRDGRFKVYLTRKGDYFISLGERQKFTAKVGADLFISIHSNANPYHPWKRGVEFYVLSDKGIYRKWIDLAVHPREARHFIDDHMVRDRYVRKKVIKTALEFTQDEGEELAESLRRVWCHRLAKYIPCGGIYKRSFAVLKVPGVPTVLVELGYMTNKRDLKYLTDPRFEWSIAKTLYLGILDYLNLSPPKEVKK
jgi:N-acetylmuramoyl-L-alanine amidase